MIDDDLLAIFHEEMAELLNELEGVLLELEEDPGNGELISRTYRALHTIKGNGAMVGYTAIESFAHELEKVFDRLRSHEMSVEPELISLTLDARDEIASMLLESGEGAESETRKELLAAMGRLLAAPEVAGEATHREEAAREATLCETLVERGFLNREDLDLVLRDREGSGAASDRRSRKRAGEGHPAAADGVSSIRVDTLKLDCLMDLVSELVTVQARLSRLPQLEREIGERELEVVAEEVERLTCELRDNAFSIRMVPIGTTFGKFRRLVRDLSREIGREVDLVTEGGDTELDKTVIEKLVDPLMHLIRNGIDHGIEPPQVRREAGKPRRGKVRLAASQSGADILIEIGDDGGGMDAGMILREAVKRGLIDDGAGLSEGDIFALVFRPGFSTAGTVTSVSGRGVGMDVVKTAVDALRGSVTVESSLGRGTTVFIKLPLTLAIIEGLEVISSREHFILPLPYVEECVETYRQREGHRLIVVRGELVPCVSLREWAGLAGDSAAIEQTVITRTGESRVGLVVDHVVGKCQAVVKSLGKMYRDVEGFAGATILSDGTIALILDVPRLVRAVEADADKAAPDAAREG